MNHVVAGTDPLKVFSCPFCCQGDEWIVSMERSQPEPVFEHLGVWSYNPARLTGWRLRCGHFVKGGYWTLYYIPRPGGWLVYFGRPGETPKWEEGGAMSKSSGGGTTGGSGTSPGQGAGGSKGPGNDGSKGGTRPNTNDRPKGK